jgi:ribosomal protein L14
MQTNLAFDGWQLAVFGALRFWAVRTAGIFRGRHIIVVSVKAIRGRVKKGDVRKAVCVVRLQSSP